MKPWRAEAFRRFPELSGGRHEACGWADPDSPYELWHALWELFVDAYGSPRNEDMIRRIYSYCDWCLAQPAGESAEDDLGSCVAVCFFENIPTLREAADDMPRWWTRSDVLGTKAILSHRIGEAGFARILGLFDLPSGLLP